MGPHRCPSKCYFLATRFSAPDSKLAMIAKAIEKTKTTDPTVLIVGFNPERINSPILDEEFIKRGGEGE